MNNDLEKIKQKLSLINSTYEVCEGSRLRRIHRHSISDLVEDFFSEMIYNKINNKNLYFDIAPDLTLDFKNAKDLYSEFIKKIGKTPNKSCTYQYKPDLIIYKKNGDLNIIFAIIEFKNDCGWQRDMFGELIPDKEWRKKYKNCDIDTFYSERISSNDDKYYGFIRQHIMEYLNNNQSIRISYSKEKTQFKVADYCKTYIICGSASNGRFNHIYACYKNNFSKKFDKCFINFYAFFNESVRFDDDKDSIKLTYCEIGNINLFEQFFKDLTQDIESKMKKNI